MPLPEAIMPIADGEDQYARVMLYGDAGVGKTTLAASSPKCLMLLHDPDEGRYARKLGTEAKRWVVRDYSDLTEAVEFLKMGDHEFEWVWLDNGSLFQDRGLQEIMEEVVMAKPHRNVFLPDKPEYMLNQNRFMYLVREMCTLPMNIGIVGSEMVGFDKDGDEVVLPMFQGGGEKFSNKLCGMMGSVWYMEVGKAKKGDEIVQVRKLITQKADNVMAKDRDGTIGTMQNPTMEKILAKIEVPAPKKAAAAKKAGGVRKATGRVGGKPTGTVAKRASTGRPVKKAGAARRPAGTK